MKYDSELEVGQILWLKVRYQSETVSTIKHPMLVAKINKDYIEVIALDKTEGKMHQLFHYYNCYINSDNPKETAIYEDSYAQLNTKLTIEKIDELKLARKTLDKITKGKLDNVLSKYDDYQNKYGVDDERKVHMSREEILNLNVQLKPCAVKE